MKATYKQIEIAKAFDIPLNQAHTINVEKARNYQDYLKSPEADINKFLDELEEERKKKAK